MKNRITDVELIPSSPACHKPMLSEVVIEDNKFRPGLSKYIHLKTDGETFILSWELPVNRAWLVMVDECILKIDFLYNDRKLPWSQSCFPVGMNFKPFLKFAKWSNKSIAEGDGCCVYNFA